MAVTLLVVGQLLASMASGELSSNPKSGFAVRMEVNGYPIIYRSVYTITSTEILVTHTETESEPHRVYYRRLTKGQSHAFGLFLRRLPLEELRAVYDNPNIQDGFVISFAISPDGRPPKTVEIANTRQTDLAGLCVEINKLVPRKWEIRYLEEP